MGDYIMTENNTMTATSATPLRASDYPMMNHVLLTLPAWEPARLAADLLTTWHINSGPIPSDMNEPWLFHANGSLVVIGLERHPVPDGIATHAAANSPDWPDAKEVAQSHLAHLAVAVIAETASLVENARTAMKVLASLCEDPSVRAISAAGRLFAPEVYRRGALMMQGNERAFPIFNVVGFGLWRRSEESPLSGFTIGLDHFGVPEVEVIEGNLGPRETQSILVAAAVHQIESGRAFAEGETVTLGEKDWDVSRRTSEALGVITTHLVRHASMATEL